MAHNIEDRVRTACARILQVSPHNIRPESVLFMGEINRDQLKGIVNRVENDFDIALPEGSYWLWTSVGDVIEAVERALGAERAAA